MRKLLAHSLPPQMTDAELAALFPADAPPALAIERHPQVHAVAGHTKAAEAGQSGHLHALIGLIEVFKLVRELRSHHPHTTNHSCSQAGI